MSSQMPPKPYYKGNTEYYSFTSFKDAAEFAREEAIVLNKPTSVSRDAGFWLVTIFCSLEDRIGYYDRDNIDDQEDAFDVEQYNVVDLRGFWKLP